MCFNASLLISSLLLSSCSFCPRDMVICNRIYIRIASTCCEFPCNTRLGDNRNSPRALYKSKMRSSKTLLSRQCDNISSWNLFACMNIHFIHALLLFFVPKYVSEHRKVTYITQANKSVRK